MGLNKEVEIVVVQVGRWWCDERESESSNRKGVQSESL